MAINVEQTLGFNLHISAFVLKQALKNMLKQAKSNLTTEEFVLFMLISKEGIEQADLQTRLYKDKTNITHLLDRLVEKDLVIRQMSHASRRQQVVALSKAGKAKQEELIPLLQAFSQHAAEGIANEDQQTTVKSLQQLRENVA